MAKHSSRFLQLAKLGATHRYYELEADLSALTKAFPHVGYGSAVSRAIDRFTEPAATIERKSAQKRGKLSAAGRRAIAAAQRARWAKIKARGRKRRGMSAAS